jgi:hypothetical protein
VGTPVRPPQLRLSFVYLGICWIVAALRLIPDRRIEKVVLACEDERRAKRRSAD